VSATDELKEQPVTSFWNARDERKRGNLRIAAGARWGDLSYLLGGRCEQATPSGQPLDGAKESWKPDIEMVKETIKFAMSTGCLG